MYVCFLISPTINLQGQVAALFPSDVGHKVIYVCVGP